MKLCLCTNGLVLWQHALVDSNDASKYISHGTGDHFLYLVMALTHVMGPKITPQYNRRAKNESPSPSPNLTPQRAITLGTAHSAHLR